jgi:predicted NBD/HSP70 family sugar kinase
MKGDSSPMLRAGLTERPFRAALKAARYKTLRDINELVVLHIIRERQPISRLSVAELAGMDPATVSRILQRLLRSGLVSEVASGPSTRSGGRKPRYVSLNPLKYSVIGVEIASRETFLALSDFTGQIQEFRRMPNTKDAEETVTAVAEEILGLIRRARRFDRFGGVGVGLIGLIDPEEGTILEGENLGWPEPIEVGKILRSKIKDVPIYYENAARLSAWGEIWFGSVRLSGIRDFVYIDINEGVGTGIIINGQLYRGSRNGAGEFGHICVDPRGPRCSCGSSGCLEAFASDLATIERYARKSGVPDASGIDMQLIVDLAKRGDAFAIESLKETARRLGLGLASVIYALNPEAIIIGGKIAEAWSLVEEEIRSACAERVSQPFLSATAFLPSRMPTRPSLMGAIGFVLAQNFALPQVPFSAAV